MSQQPAALIKYVCPKCRWRAKAKAGTPQNLLRCQKCKAALIVYVEEGGDLQLDPAEPDLPPPSRYDHEFDDSVEYQLAPTTDISPAVRLTREAESVVVRDEDGGAGGLTGKLVEAETTRSDADLSPAQRLYVPKPIEPEKKSDFVVDPPPGAGMLWAYTRGIYTFPFWPNALAQWLFCALGMMLGFFISFRSVGAMATANQFAVVLGGALGLAAFYVSLYVLSYLSSCFVEIVINTTYNVDKAHDWPEADWRDRLFCFLRLLYWGVFSGGIAAGIAGLCSRGSPEMFAAVFAGVECVLFPIVLLSALEADSIIWPVSGPILVSLIRSWYAWLGFYLIVGVLHGAYEWGMYRLFDVSELAVALLAGPLLATLAFIDARLLGRLTWLILRKQNADDPRYAKRAKENEARAKANESAKAEQKKSKRRKPVDTGVKFDDVE